MFPAKKLLIRYKKYSKYKVVYCIYVDLLTISHLLVAAIGARALEQIWVSAEFRDGRSSHQLKPSSLATPDSSPRIDHNVGTEQTTRLTFNLTWTCRCWFPASHSQVTLMASRYPGAAHILHAHACPLWLAFFMPDLCPGHDGLWTISCISSSCNFSDKSPFLLLRGFKLCSELKNLE